MNCWWCYWGWPEAINAIYLRAKADIDDLLQASEENDWTSWPGEPSSGEHALEFGPAHIVWSDENWDSAEWCLKECDEPGREDWNQDALEIVRSSLRQLMMVPERFKTVPEGYDDEHPENFPPPEWMRITKKRS